LAAGHSFPPKLVSGPFCFLCEHACPQPQRIENAQRSGTLVQDAEQIVEPAADPVIPNPVFSNVFNPNVDTPVSTAPAAKEDDSNEDDGDYFNDLLSILNKRS